MMFLNKQQLIGRIGRDPEVRVTKTDKTVASFSVATTAKYGDTEKTTWHQVNAWGKLAEFIQTYVKKGALVFVEGPTDHREYETKDGEKKKVTEVTALTFILLATPKDKEGGEATDDRRPAAPAPESDLPF